jgi:hypothetical protein
MAKAQQINDLLRSFERDTNYLELGVQEGITFDAVDSARKTAVDPRFLFTAANDQVKTYQEVSSDAFFSSIPKDERFDVVFIDGLHTFEQTLRDFINTTSFLADDGYILIDDVKPSSYAASLRDSGQAQRLKLAIGEKSGSWMGDVFRLVYFIDSFFQQFSFQLIDPADCKLVVWRAPRELVTERRVKDITRKGYRDTLVDFGECFSVMEFEDWFSSIRQ